MPGFQKGFASVLFLVLLLAGVGVGTYLVQQRTNLIPKASESNYTNISNQGWDYNLTHRCIKSTDKSKDNYYEDLKDCPDPGKNWTIAVESEKSLGASCPGPVTQSFPINKRKKSPVSLKWISHTDELGRRNWSVNLKTDFSRFNHPCGAGNFTWAAFMDHGAHGGGTFPKPMELVFSSTLSFNDYLPAGASRAIVGWQGAWDDTDDGIVNPTAKEIEINLYSSPNWGDAHPDKDIIAIFKNRDGLGTDFINMDGKQLGLEIPKAKDTFINVEFYRIIKDLVRRGYFKAPVDSWENSSTRAIYLASELKNEKANNAGVADLWFTNFRTEKVSTSILKPPRPSILPSPSGTEGCKSDADCPGGQKCDFVLCAHAPCPNICVFPTRDGVATTTGNLN